MTNSDKDDDLRPEYNLAKLGKDVRGKYLKRNQGGSNVVAIDPDLTDAFPIAGVVNDALRELLSRRAKSEARAGGQRAR